MGALIRKLETPSFLNKLFFSLLALILAITILLGGVLLVSYYTSVEGMTNRFISVLLKQSNYSITYMNETSQRLATSLHYEDDVIAFLNLNRNDPIQVNKTHLTVREIYQTHPYVESVYLYNKKLDLMVDTRSGYQTTLADFADQETARVLEQAESGEVLPYVHNIRRGKYDYSVYSYVVPNYDKDDALRSALVVNTSVEELTRSLQNINANNADARFAVASPDGDLLLHPTFDSQEEITDLQELVRETITSGQPGADEVVRLGGRKYILAYSSSNANGWYIYGLVPYWTVFSDVLWTTLWAMAFTLALMAAGAYLALRTARRLNKPVEAIHQMVRSEDSTGHEPLQVQEFQAIADAVVQMRKNDKEHSAYRKKASKIVRKEFLEHLFCGTAVYTPEDVQAHLTSYGCTYLTEKPCVMCLFSIDNYTAFSRSNNPRERSALRFAIINLATELLQQHYDCEMVAHGSSKFVAVIGCPEDVPPTQIRLTLEEALGKVQEIVKNHLDFSLTVAHGTLFRGLDHLPRMYENLEELLLLRVHHGYGKVLGPHMAEDLSLEDFHVSSVLENALVNSVVDGNYPQALEQFELIAADLFQYSYNKIMLYLTHLAYRILNIAQEQSPVTSQQIAEAFKILIARLPQCEIETDFRASLCGYLQQVSGILAAQKVPQEAQGANVLIGKVLSIIDSDYRNPELCLSSIADDLGLSTHYIGQLFRVDQGKSVSQYILDLRLEKIAQAVRESSHPFSDLMEDVGFEAKQKNYIYTCFKKHFGVTVKNYRAQYNDAQ